MAGDLVVVDEASLTCLIEGRDVLTSCRDEGVFIIGCRCGIDFLSECLKEALDLTVAQGATLGLTNVFLC